jgi:hypothetical protein
MNGSGGTSFPAVSMTLFIQRRLVFMAKPPVLVTSVHDLCSRLIVGLQWGSEMTVSGKFQSGALKGGSPI